MFRPPRTNLSPLPRTVPQPTAMSYDVLILGGGPAGAAAALQLARAGHRVAVLEKTAFPRFHVGESLIPADTDVFQRLGLADALAPDALPQVRKDGVEFLSGDGAHGNRIKFADGLNPHGAATVSFNAERAPLDAALLTAATGAGAKLFANARVESILRLTDGDVAVQTAAGLFEGRYLIDATGQGAVIGRHLKQRRHFEHAALRKIAYFGHFENVDRDNALGDDEISMVLCDEGWFWMIPIDDRRVSIGMVLDSDVAKDVQRRAQPKGSLPNHQMLAWGIARCPLIAQRTQNATCPEKNHVASDFSYTCAPYSGPGHFLVGDAATFLDPVFSTGIFLGLESALDAADRLDRVLKGTLSPARARAGYNAFVKRATQHFFKLIQAFYAPAFRDLFLDGTGPLSMHRAAITLLAGHVLPRPRLAVRWRMAAFYACVRVQGCFPLVKRKPSYALQTATPTPPKPRPARPAPRRQPLADLRRPLPTGK